MAEKQLSQSKRGSNYVVTVFYDNVADKISRIDCDCPDSIIITITKDATTWSHTFSAGTGQSQTVSENFPVTEDVNGKPVYSCHVEVKF